LLLSNEVKHTYSIFWTTRTYAKFWSTADSVKLRYVWTLVKMELRHI